MVHILESVPGFGSSLGKAIGGGFGQGMSKGMEYAQKLGLEKQKYDLETKKKLEAMLSENKALQEKYGIDLTGVTEPSTRKAIISSEMKKSEESKEKKLKEGEEQEGWERVFSSLEENLPYTGATLPFTKAFMGKIPWSEAAERRENFDVTAFQLERHARQAHTKGAMGEKVYKSLLSKLPDASLSEAQNRGRIKAWKDELLKAKKKEIQMGKEGKETNKITPAIVDSFLDEANNDVTEARRMATEAGYTW